MSNCPLRIGMSCYPSIGGSGVVATLLGIELAKRGHEVHFISYDRPFRLPEKAERIHFHPVAINTYGLFKYPDYTLPLSVKMAEVSRNYQLDVLHVHYAVPHATAAILAHCMLAPHEQPRIVTTLHGTDTTLLGSDPGYGPAIHHALTHSDEVTTVSEFLKNETRRVIGFDGPIEVIHNFYERGVPLQSRESLRAELGIRDDQVMLVHTSNLRPVKRIDLLLETVARIRPSDSFRLVIVAGGSFSPYVEMVQRLGLQDRIIVRESVPEVESYMQAADIGLFTSESESFCLSILEAMSFGCPSVATRVGGIPELMIENKCGLLVDFGDADALARQVERLISDKELRERLGKNGKIRAENFFSADRLVPMYESLYRKQYDIAQACEVRARSRRA